MHHRLTSTVYVLVICACALGFVPAHSVLLAVAAVAVAVVGVPHGGLDHWTGRRWLQPRLGGAWWSLFFPVYLAVAVAVAAGWIWLPLLTAMTFFLLSAWHFGLDDEPLGVQNEWSKHLLAVALGGLVIWIPAVWRADEMRAILSMIIPNEWSLSASMIVASTQFLAALFLPIAAVAIVYGLVSASPFQAAPPIVDLVKDPASSGSLTRSTTSVDKRPTAVRYMLLWIVCMTTPILVSFGLYFCLWHSVRGLNVLYQQSGLTVPRFAVAVLPLSLTAIGLIVVGSLTWNQGSTLPAAATQALFIGLSAMAVPHLLLHGFEQSRSTAPKSFNTLNPAWVTS